MPGQLELRVTRDPDGVVIALVGELDLTSAPLFEQELLAVESSKPARVLIDLSRLEFMDSTGLRSLLLAREQAATNDHELVLRRGPRQVQRVLELTKTLNSFTFEN